MKRETRSRGLEGNYVPDIRWTDVRDGHGEVASRRAARVKVRVQSTK